MAMNERRLYRSRSDKMMGGVCGGLANYFGIDSTLIRLIFAILFIVGVGSPALIYLVLWIVMRQEPVI